MGTLFRQSLTLSRLREAFARVLDNHGVAGIDGMDVDTFARMLEPQIKSLREDVLSGRYQPSPIKRVWLPRPGKTPRPLGIPTVRDRVLHTAVAITITPLLEEEFEDCSFAYRRGRSVRMAVERIGFLQRQGFRWVVEADIEHFFDCIPHDRLLKELSKVVQDAELLALIKQWLVAPVQDETQLLPVTLGVVQGSPISPLLANLYLDHLDEALLDKGFALIRYADDFIVLAKSRERAEAAVELSAEVLTELELKLNPLKTRVVNFETGFKFLGWNFVRSLAVPASHPAEEHQPSISPVSPPKTITTESVENADESETLTETTMQIAFAEAMAACAERKTSESSVTETASELIDPLEQDSVTTGEVGLMPPDNIQRTLYLVDPAVSLATENRHLLVRKDEEIVLDLLAANVDQVMIFGRNSVSTAALVCCLQHGISVAYLSRMGKFYGRLGPPQGEAVNLLTAQFACHAAHSLDLALAREFVRGKLSNSALLLARYSRHRKTEKDSRIHEAINQLRDLALRVHGAGDLDVLRGLEGAGAAAYFSVWRIWLTPEWKFGARAQQTGTDPINALLDFGYTLLYQAVAGLIQARGLNPWLGHLHTNSAGHLALASDLMEEFRAIVVDAVVLNLCLNHQLIPRDFTLQSDGYTLHTEAARIFVRAIETHLNTERRHPQSGDLLDMRRIMDAQVRFLCQAYRNNDATLYKSCVFR